MGTPEASREALIRRYAVLAGLTPLVPVPFVDDVLRGYLRGRLVRALAEPRGFVPPEPDVRALAHDPGRGCLAGCLIGPVVYLLKKVFRKIFYFLEWKRAVDVASETYHFGRLVDIAFERRWYGMAGTYTAAQLRAAVDAVLAGTHTGPVEKAMAEAFAGSRSGLAAAARALRHAARGLTRRAPVARTEEVIASLERQEASEIADVSAAVGEALREVEPTYFDRLGGRLKDELSALASRVTNGSGAAGDPTERDGTIDG